MASEIRVNKINSRTGVGTITLSPTGVDFTGIATVATLKATTGIVTTFSATGNATVGGTLNVTGETTFSTHVNLGDDDKAKFGASGDLEIYHSSSGSFIDNTGNVTLALRQFTDDADIVLSTDDGSGGVTPYIRCDGSDGYVRLYYYGSQKLQTESAGIDVTGQVKCDSLDVDGNIDLDGSKITFNSSGNVLKWADNVAAYFGDGDDLRIYHDGSNSWVTDNGAGSLKIRSTAGSGQILGTTSNDNMAVFTVDGASELYYDNSKKFETKSDGIDVTGEVQCDSLDVDGAAVVDGKITLGASHTGGEVLRVGKSSGTSYLGFHNGGTHVGFVGYADQLVVGGASDEFAVRSQDDLLFAAGGNTEKVRITSNGLTFNGDTAAANALDDYEEGTWTPTANSYNGTLSVNSATYVKIGQLCFVHAYVSFSNTTDGDIIIIGGLPFTAFGINNNYYVLSAHTSGGSQDLALRVQGTTTNATAVHLSSGDGDAKPTYTSLKTEFIIFSGCFKTT